MIAQAGLRVERHDDHFGPTTADVEWISEIGKRGWIAITHNKEIRYNTRERDMVMRAGVPLLMLIGKQRHDVLARNFIHSIPRILGFLDQHDPPFIARVYKPSDKEFDEGKPGRVDLWLDYEKWSE
jgi:hypothetical protein